MSNKQLDKYLTRLQEDNVDESVLLTTATIVGVTNLIYITYTHGFILC